MSSPESGKRLEAAAGGPSPTEAAVRVLQNSLGEGIHGGASGKELLEARAQDNHAQSQEGGFLELQRDFQAANDSRDARRLTRAIALVERTRNGVGADGAQSTDLLWRP